MALHNTVVWILAALCVSQCSFMAYGMEKDEKEKEETPLGQQWIEKTRTKQISTLKNALENAKPVAGKLNYLYLSNESKGPRINKLFL